MAKCNDLIGQVFGFLKVVERAENTKHGKSQWWCNCSLTGRRVKVVAGDLKSGHTTTGRTQKEAVTIANRRHGHSGRGSLRTPTYYSWKTMIQRTTNPNHIHYSYYGARGILPCDKWLRFEGFLEDMGERPEGKTLDRIDNDLGYSKANCKWSTPKEQRANQRIYKECSA